LEDLDEKNEKKKEDSSERSSLSLYKYLQPSSSSSSSFPCVKREPSSSIFAKNTKYSFRKARKKKSKIKI
jgi:hypothetical protein